MTHEDPSRRPSMDEVMDQFTAIALHLPDRAAMKPLRKRWRHRFPYLFRV